MANREKWKALVREILESIRLNHGEKQELRAPNVTELLGLPLPKRRRDLLEAKRDVEKLIVEEGPDGNRSAEYYRFHDLLAAIESKLSGGRQDYRVDRWLNLAGGCTNAWTRNLRTFSSPERCASRYSSPNLAIFATSFSVLEMGHFERFRSTSKHCGGVADCQWCDRYKKARHRGRTWPRRF